MSLSDIVDVQITADTRFPTRLGFGTPLVIGFLTGFVDRVKTVSGTSELAALGIVEDDQQSGKVFDAVKAIFSQNPRPKRIKIGRRLGAPSQSIKLTPTDPTEDNVTTVTIGGVPFTFTSTVAATIAEITAGLTLLINPDLDAIILTGVSAAAPQVLTGASLDGVIGTAAIAPPRNLVMTFDASVDWDPTTMVVTGKDAAGRTITEDFAIETSTTATGAKLFASVTQIDIPTQTGAGGTFTGGVGKIFANAELEITATDNATDLDVAADNVGDWYPFTGFDLRLEVDDQTAEPGITLGTDLAAMTLEDADWYGLIVADGQSQAQIESAAAFVETNKKFYIAHSFDTNVTQDTTLDVASQLQLSAFFRSKVIYMRQAAGTFPDAAWMGSVFPRDPGSVTWEFQELTGVVVDTLDPGSLNADIITELRAKNVSYYLNVRGFRVTLHSKTAAGEFMDVVRFIDFLTDAIGVDVFAFLLSLPKTPFTTIGIAGVGGAVKAVGRRGQRIGGLSLDQDLTVVTPDLADLDPADVANRILKDVTFNWILAGAIHAAEIRGNVSSV